MINEGISLKDCSGAVDSVDLVCVKSTEVCSHCAWALLRHGTVLRFNFREW